VLARMLFIGLATAGLVLAACAAWRARDAERAEQRHDAYMASQRDAESQREIDRGVLAAMEAEEARRAAETASANTAPHADSNAVAAAEAERVAKERAETERTLLRARDSGRGCDGFADLAPLAVSRAALAAGEERPMNDCSDGAKYAVCFETPAGYFVPVSVTLSECTWTPWFVPKTDGKPVPSQDARYEEFDIAFSVDSFVDDFGNGAELIVARGYEHPEGAGSWTTLRRHLPDGRVTELPFAELKDIDGDGLRDGILHFESEENDICALDDDVWARISHQGPTLVAHRTPQGGFSFRDAAARQARAKACSDVSGSPVVLDRRGNVIDHKTAQRLLCRAADGEPVESLLAVLRQRCSGDPAHEDCPKRRAGTCFRNTLEHWLGLLGELGAEYTPN
jgi:hypothetical protein